MDFYNEDHSEVSSIYPVVLKDKNNTILVDCSYVGTLEQLEESLNTHKIPPSSLTGIIITHHDHDHMGTLAELKKKYPHIQIMASEKEEPYISGREKSSRLIQAEEMQEQMPEEQKAFGEQFIQLLKSVLPVKVDKVLHYGDILDICGGCKVLNTQGHTDGHISLYLEDLDTLIAGDAAVIENGELVVANPQFALHLEEAEQALEVVKNTKANKIICYHGGVFEKL